MQPLLVVSLAGVFAAGACFWVLDWLGEGKAGVRLSPSLSLRAGAVRNAGAYFPLAVAFNAAVYVHTSIYGGLAATVNNPITSSVLVLIVGVFIARAGKQLERTTDKTNSGAAFTYALLAGLFAAALCSRGVFRHLRLQDAYAASAEAGTHSAWLWMVGIALNVFGVATHARAAAGAAMLILTRPLHSVCRTVALLLVAACLAGIVVHGLRPTAGLDSSDCAGWQASYDAQLLPGFGLNRTSTFLPMRDGVRLAADVYLPTGNGALPPDTPRPTILHITRYNRALRVAWPFSLVFGDTVRVLLRAFVRAFVRLRLRVRDGNEEGRVACHAGHNDSIVHFFARSWLRFN